MFTLTDIMSVWSIPIYWRDERWLPCQAWSLYLFCYLLSTMVSIWKVFLLLCTSRVVSASVAVGTRVFCLKYDKCDKLFVQRGWQWLLLITWWACCVPPLYPVTMCSWLGEYTYWHLAAIHDKDFYFSTLTRQVVRSAFIVAHLSESNPSSELIFILLCWIVDLYTVTILK